MTMPRKGVRKIIVNNKEYKYLVKFVRTDYGCLPTNRAKVTIESPDGKYYKDSKEQFSITPAYVKKLIEHWPIKEQ